MNKKYIIFTSFLGFMVIGISLIEKIMGERQYSLLIKFWFRYLFLAPLALAISVGVIIIEGRFSDMPVLKNIIYIFCGLVIYVFGIVVLKNLLKWKKEIVEPCMSRGAAIITHNRGRGAMGTSDC